MNIRVAERVTGYLTHIALSMSADQFAQFGRFLAQKDGFYRIDMGVDNDPVSIFEAGVYLCSQVGRQETIMYATVDDQHFFFKTIGEEMTLSLLHGWHHDFQSAHLPE